jgi:uncharacterized protein YkwD
MTGPVRYLVLALCLCATSCTVCGDDPSRPLVADLPSGPRDVELVAPPAETYAGRHRQTPFDKRVLGSLGEVPKSLEYDPCLARAAAEFARHLRARPGGEIELPDELQSVVLHHVGCTDGWVASHVFQSSSLSDDDFVAHVRKVMADRLDTSTHFGVGRARAQPPMRWTWVLFASERHVTLSPLPRRVAVDSEVVIAGTLAPEMKEPRVLILAPGTAVEEADIDLTDGRFRAVWKVFEPGEHWIEVLVSGPLGPRVAALFPVWVEVAPPTKVTLTPQEDERDITKESHAEDLMFRLLNQDRQRHGFPVLERDSALDQIARGHSEDMKENGFFAHVSPGKGTLDDRFAAQKYASQSSGENIARNRSVHDAEMGLLQSLGHRENILNAEFTNVGIGAAFSTDQYGRRTMYLTQNFARPQRTLTGLQFREEVYKRLAAMRSDKRLFPLKRSDKLQRIAAARAREAEKAEGLSDRIRADLRKNHFKYRAFHIQTHVVLDPADVKIPDAARARKVRRVAVGAYPMRDPSGRTRWSTLLLLLE